MKVAKSKNKGKEDILVQWTPIFGDERNNIDLIGKFASYCRHGAFTEDSTGDIYSLGGMSSTSK